MFRKTSHPIPQRGGWSDTSLSSKDCYCFLLGSVLRLSAYYLYTQVKSSNVYPQSRSVKVPTTSTPECYLIWEQGIANIIQVRYTEIGQTLG